MSYYIRSSAPIRICDLGGWTDTRFSEIGNVLNFAVSPRVYCEINVESAMHKKGTVQIFLPNLGQKYIYKAGKNSSGGNRFIDAIIECMSFPFYVNLKINVFSEIPPGSSTGTSAAVLVSMIGALSKLNGQCLSPKEILTTVHEIEIKKLGRNAGVQDQICSLYGGITLIKMLGYPKAKIVNINLKREIIDELNHRLLLVFLGGSHDSSNVHKILSSDLEKGFKASVLNELASTAEIGLSKLMKNDFRGFGETMIYNHELQRELNYSLINKEARKIIKIAKDFGAVGWKVNGAGGPGGSLTIMGSKHFKEKEEMIKMISNSCKNCYNIPIEIDSCGLWLNNF